MNFSASEWMYIAMTAAGVVVWFVRLEGRINLIETRANIDEKRLNEKFADIYKLLESIERKLDALAPFGLGLRGIDRRIARPDEG